MDIYVVILSLQLSTTLKLFKIACQKPFIRDSLGPYLTISLAHDVSPLAAPK